VSTAAAEPVPTVDDVDTDDDAPVRDLDAGAQYHYFGSWDELDGCQIELQTLADYCGPRDAQRVLLQIGGVKGLGTTPERTATLGPITGGSTALLEAARRIHGAQYHWPSGMEPADHDWFMLCAPFDGKQAMSERRMPPVELIYRQAQTIPQFMHDFSGYSVRQVAWTWTGVCFLTLACYLAIKTGVAYIDANNVHPFVARYTPRGYRHEVMSALVATALNAPFAPSASSATHPPFPEPAPIDP
jgi:hypothetical protein